MAVLMLKDTRYNGVIKEGTIQYDLPSDVEARWIKVGIATPVFDELFDDEEVESVEEDEDTEDDDEDTDIEDIEQDEYQKLTAKDLYKLCIAKGFEIEPKMPRKHYINLLNS